MSVAEALRRPEPKPAFMIMPGQWHFGDQPVLLRTLLGSCVAITLWHPQRRIGGMCHYLLPSRRRTASMRLEGRFGDEALELMVAEQYQARTRPQDYVAHIYGGADTLADFQGQRLNIGERNIEIGWSLIDEYGFQLQGVDVGDDVPRTVTLDVGSGEVSVKRGPSRKPA